MSKQRIPIHLKFAIWETYGHRSGYEGVLIQFPEMEIDHIIPERVSYKPKEDDEFLKWKLKYELDDDFDIQGLENLYPSTRSFNLLKSDNGLYDEGDAFTGHIFKALTKAKYLKLKIERLSKEYKDKFSKGYNKAIATTLDGIEKGILNSRPIMKEILYQDFDKNKVSRDEIQYDLDLLKFRSNRLKYYNYGELFLISVAIFFASENKKQDLDFWHELLDEFFNHTENDEIKNKIFYYKFIANLDAGRIVKFTKEQLKNYFDSFEGKANKDLIVQGSDLFLRFFLEISINNPEVYLDTYIDTFREIRDFLLKKIEEDINSSKSTARKAYLEYFKFIVNYTFTSEDLTEDQEVLDENLWFNLVLSNLQHLINQVRDVKYFDFDLLYTLIRGIQRAFQNSQNYLDIIELSDDVEDLVRDQRYNTSTISDLMDDGKDLIINEEIKQTINRNESKHDISKTIDQISEILGSIKCENYIQAISYFNKAAQRSLSPDSIHNCIFSFFWMGDCFSELNLLYAKKYSYLIGIHLASQEPDNLAVQLMGIMGLEKLSLLAHTYLNNDLEGIYFTHLSHIYRGQYSPEGLDSIQNEYEYLAKICILNLAHSLRYARANSELLFNILIKFIGNYWGQDFENIDIGRLDFNFISKTDNQLDDNNSDREYFNDINEYRTYQWDQSNVRWIVKWKNTFLATSIAEEFMAYFQILLFQLKGIQINQTFNEININLKDPKHIEIYFNQEKLYNLRLPKNRSTDYIKKIYSQLIDFLLKITSSPDELSKRIIEPLYEVEPFINVYSEIFSKFVDQNLFTFYDQIISGLKFLNK